MDIGIKFTNEEQRKHHEVKLDKDRRESYPVYLDGETVSGKVRFGTLKQPFCVLSTRKLLGQHSSKERQTS